MLNARHSLQMRDDQALSDDCGEQCPAIGNVMGETQPRLQRAHCAVLVTRDHQMKRIENVQPAKERRLARIIHWRLTAQLELHAPVAIRQSRSAGHRLHRRPVLLYQVFVFGIIIRRRAAKDGVGLLRLLLGDSGALHLGEG